MAGDKGRPRRANGEGSIYQRASDGKWVGSAYVYTSSGTGTPLAESTTRASRCRSVRTVASRTCWSQPADSRTQRPESRECTR